MNEIEVGKKYDVHFEHIASLHNVELLYIPAAPGDTWRFITASGDEVAVGYFALMRPSVFNSF